MLAARAVETRINDDTSDYAGSRILCPKCQSYARYVERRKKGFNSALGKLILWRAYYHCGACDSGFYPRDLELGIEGTSLSPAVTRMIGLVGAMCSFKEGSELLDELAGVQVTEKQVERTAEALGRLIATDEIEHSAPDADRHVPATLYLGIDGTGIPVRPSEVADRAGKQPDGSAKTREVKLCTVWSAESRDKDGLPVRDKGSITYTAAVESADSSDPEVISEFAQRVQRESNRRRFSSAKRRVVIGDGAQFIWNIADELFPGAIQIIDRYHAKGYLSSAAKAIWGPTSEISAHWAKQRRDELDSGDIDRLIERFTVHAPSCEEARRCVDYLVRNRDRLSYQTFHEQGLCTSTGVVEAGCKTAIGTRLKRAGMHWSVAGANAITALRCAKLSNRFDAFWDRHRKQRLAA